jgi:hypothetical protein
VSEGQPAEQSAAAAVWRWLIGPPLRAREVAKERITPVEGLPALSLDALTSVAYGPEAIIVVLAVAGASALHLVLPITITIVLLLAILVFSYRQVIDAYPNGGGAYAVSRANLGHRASLVAAAALVVDYTLTVAVSIAAGVAALTSAFPEFNQDTVVICLVILAVVTVLNLRGLGDAARAFLLPTMVFIVGLLVIIVIGLIHPLALHAPQPGVPLVPRVPLEAVSVLLLLKAFSAGCSALTGVEAIANGVPQFKEPRVKRAKRTEMLLGTILGVMLLGLAVLADRWHIGPRSRPDGAEPDHSHGHRKTPGLLRDVADHHAGARAGRQHFLRRAARAGQPARQGSLPAAPVPPARRPAGVRARDLDAVHLLRRAAHRGARERADADPAVRHRRVHRLHAVAKRPGRALVADPAAALGVPGRH